MSAVSLNVQQSRDLLLAICVHSIERKKAFGTRIYVVKTFCNCVVTPVVRVREGGKKLQW
jgi:hypothetical protein